MGESCSTDCEDEADTAEVLIHAHCAKLVLVTSVSLYGANTSDQ
jgi:hypothetical protein